MFELGVASQGRLSRVFPHPVQFRIRMGAIVNAFGLWLCFRLVSRHAMFLGP